MAAKKNYDFSANAVLDFLEPVVDKGGKRWKRVLSEPHDIESPRGPGRPTKLDAKLQEHVLNAIRLGQSMERAALAAGIHRVTLWRWLEAGREGREPYFSFFQAALSADAQCERRMLQTIFIASQGGKITVTETDKETGEELVREQTPVWTAAAWVLERKYGWVAPKLPAGPTEDKPEEGGVPLEAVAGAKAAMVANTTGAPEQTPEQRIAELEAKIAAYEARLAAKPAGDGEGEGDADQPG